MKDGSGVVPSPQSPLKELMKFMNPAPSVTESRIHKIFEFRPLSKLVGGGGGGGGWGTPPLLLFCEAVYRLQFCLDFTSLKEVVEFY